MSFFLFPKTFCEELEQVVAKFCWHKRGGKQGIHWYNCKGVSQIGVGTYLIDSAPSFVRRLVFDEAVREPN